jgi:hypothetical protein
MYAWSVTYQSPRDPADLKPPKTKAQIARPPTRTETDLRGFIATIPGSNVRVWALGLAGPPRTGKLDGVTLILRDVHGTFLGQGTLSAALPNPLPFRLHASAARMVRLFPGQDVPEVAVAAWGKYAVFGGPDGNWIRPGRRPTRCRPGCRCRASSRWTPDTPPVVVRAGSRRRRQDRRGTSGRPDHERGLPAPAHGPARPLAGGPVHRLVRGVRGDPRCPRG